MAVEILRALASLPIDRVAVARWRGPLLPELADAASRSRLEPLRRLRVTLRRFRRTRRLAVVVEEWAARRVLRQERPDLVYLNTVKSASYVLPALRLGIRVVLHGHETGDLVSGTLDRYHLAALYSQVRLVACSRAAAEDLRVVTGVKDVTVVPSAIDADRVRSMALAPLVSPAFQPDRSTVVACGTANVGKGTDLWIDVAARVHQALGDRCPRFVWIGAAGVNAYKASVRHLGLEGVVELLPPASNPYPMMAAADVVTVPSRRESSSLVVLEAMALGIPVVAFDVGGIADELGEHGILVPSGDVDGMADAIVGLLDDEQARRTLSNAASRRVDDNFGVGAFHRAVAGLVIEELGLDEVYPAW